MNPYVWCVYVCDLYACVHMGVIYVHVCVWYKRLLFGTCTHTHLCVCMCVYVPENVFVFHVCMCEQICIYVCVL